MISFNSIGHFLATVWNRTAAFIPKIEATEGTVETVTAAVPKYGPLALPLEKLAYAVLGELGSVLNAGGEAARAKLADAGLDVKVVDSVTDLLNKNQQIAVVAKAL